jgi:hypothetical protein
VRHLVTITAAPATWPALAATITGRIPAATMLHTHRTITEARRAFALQAGAFVLVDAAALAAAGDPTDLFRTMGGALVYTDPAELTGDVVGALALAGLSAMAQIPSGADWLLEQLAAHLAVGR